MLSGANINEHSHALQQAKKRERRRESVITGRVMRSMMTIMMIVSYPYDASKDLNLNCIFSPGSDMDAKASRKLESCEEKTLSEAGKNRERAQLN